MKRLFTLLFVGFTMCAFLSAAVGDTLYYDDFNRSNIHPYTAGWWTPGHAAFMIDSVAFCAADSSMLVPQGEGTFVDDPTQFGANWVFLPDTWYKVSFTVHGMADSVRNLDITRVWTDDQFYYEGQYYDAEVGNEAALRIVSAETGIRFTGEWQTITAFWYVATKGDNLGLAGPSFGLGWGGGSPLYLGGILVTESSEEEKDAFNDWAVAAECSDEPNTVETAIDNFEVSISPNPSTGMININSSENVNKVDIYSLTGSMVKSISDYSVDQVSLGDLPAGIYNIVLTSSDKIKVLRAVKQ